jgi:hypothetical protein
MVLRRAFRREALSAVGTPGEAGPVMPDEGSAAPIAKVG